MYVGKMIETRLDFKKVFKDGHFSLLPAFLLNLAAHLSIGYGYCSYLAFGWVAILSAVGAYLFATADQDSLRVSDGLVQDEELVQNKNRSAWQKYVVGNFRIIRYKEDLKDTPKHTQDYGLVSPIGYSFDTLLPVIRLRELHYQIEVGGGRHIYFYFHRIFGWMLGIILLAGFSGLIK